MKIVATVLLVVFVTLISSQQPREVADIVFRNGNIYTVDETNPKAQAVALRADRIVYVGSNSGVQSFVAQRTRIVDLSGKTMLPGLTDSHYHLIGVGLREITLNLEAVLSLEDFLSRVKMRVDKAKPGEWITGRGWIETFWKPPVFPTRWDIDKVAPNNPVVLTRADGHALVANSAALKIASINGETPNPFGGEISKTKEGEPNGMLLDAAQSLVRRHVPPLRPEDTEQAVILAVKRSTELGWTEVQDAGGTYDDVALYQKLYGEGKIRLRIYKAVYGPGPNAEKLLYGGAIMNSYGDRFTVRTIKVVSDGALGSRGAALLAPYADVPDTAGFLTVKEAELKLMLEMALKNGIQVETHAIGDRANRFVLDAYESAFRTVPPAARKIDEPRWRIEHAQIVNPADIPRFAKLGVIPSMQPSHAIGDLHFAPSRLGIDRLEGAYAWQSFLKTGVVVPGGSDAPVERGEPMIEFYAAVARKDQKGFSGEGWHLEEAVTRSQALRMFTIWPAYASFQEKLRGSIEVGKLADFTVLSADIMKIPEREILETKCLMTVIGGEIVFSAN